MSDNLYRKVKLTVTEKEQVVLDVGEVAASNSNAVLPKWGNGLIFDKKTNTLSTDLTRDELLELLAKKQNLLIEGDNITLTDNGDERVTISATGGGGGSSQPDGVAIPMTELIDWFS